MRRLIAFAAICCLLGCEDVTPDAGGGSRTTTQWYGTLTTTAPAASLDIVFTFPAAGPNTYAIYAAGTAMQPSPTVLSEGLVSSSVSGAMVLTEDAAFGIGELVGTGAFYEDEDLGHMTVIGSDCLGSHVPLSGELAPIN